MEPHSIPEQNSGSCSQHTTPFKVSHSSLLLMILVFSSGAFFGLPLARHEHLQAWDAPTHIFFSSSYLHNWWDNWELRWYGGYSRFSYPPLSHQLVALLAELTGSLKLSYGLLLWFFLSLGPYAAFRFARIFVDDASSFIAALLFVLTPAIRSMVFVHGQFSGFVSLVFVLLGLAIVSDYLKHGKILNGLAGSAFLVCAVATHHATALLFLSPVLLVTAVTRFKTRSCTPRQFALRFVVVSFTFLLGAAVVVYPFWVWAMQFHIQTPIPHASREPFLLNPSTARLFFLDLYGPLLILMPVVAIYNTTRRDHVLHMLTFLFFFVMGLGGNTTFPSLIYGEEWKWLTFERFSVWATILLLPLAGHVVAGTKSLGFYFTGRFSLALLVYFSALWCINPQSERITPPLISVQSIISGYRDYPLCAQRYLALGFGFQLPDFSTYSDAKTLDGLWHSARSDELLRISGIGALSDALYWENGRTVLEQFLDRDRPVPAVCIFINENSPLVRELREILLARNWRLHKVVNPDVSLWTRGSSSIEVLPNPSSVTKDLQLPDLIWGVLPLTSLLVATIALIYTARDNQLPE